jgi:hypothetical protein
MHKSEKCIFESDFFRGVRLFAGPMYLPLTFYFLLKLLFAANICFIKDFLLKLNVLHKHVNRG